MNWSKNRLTIAAADMLGRATVGSMLISELLKSQVGGRRTLLKAIESMHS